MDHRFAVLQLTDPVRRVFGADVFVGPDRIAELGAIVGDHGARRVMIVCGPHVAQNEPLMSALMSALQGRLAGIFDGSGPRKKLSDVFAGIEAAKRLDADAIVGVGGGSALDTARQIAAFGADRRGLADYENTALRDGIVDGPTFAAPAYPVFLVPTTFAGADIASGGSIQVLSADRSPHGMPVRTFGNVTPRAIVFDPALFEHTPGAVLRGSALNGFNKGVEAVYSSRATPIGLACAAQGIDLFARAIDAGLAPAALPEAVSGCVLVQLWRSSSLIHALARAVSRRAAVQQGVAHAVLLPAVLDSVFAAVDGRRRTFARALHIDHQTRDDAEVAAAVVERITSLRDALGLPARWSEVGVNGLERLDADATVRAALRDPLVENSPYRPTPADLRAILARVA